MTGCTVGDAWASASRMRSSAAYGPAASACTTPASMSAQVELGDGLQAVRVDRVGHGVEIDVPHERGEHVGERHAAEAIDDVAGWVALDQPRPRRPLLARARARG